MKLTSETLPYKHKVNLYENNFLLTSMTRTYCKQEIPAESVTSDKLRIANDAETAKVTLIDRVGALVVSQGSS